MSGIIISEIYPPISLGEAPHWNEDDETLIFVDYSSGNVHRHFTKSGRHQVLYVGRNLCLISIFSFFLEIY